MSSPGKKNEALERLAALYASWTTEDLVKATVRMRSDFRPEAIAAMEEELRKRDLVPDETAAIETAVREEEDRQLEKLSGLRGWLLVFLLMLTANIILITARAVSEISNLAVSVSSVARMDIASLRPIGVALSLTYLLGLFALVPFGFYVLLVLVRKTRQAPQRAVIFLACAFAHSVLTAFLSGSPLAAFPAGTSCALWLAYLTNSKRVAATYGRADS